MKVRCPQCKFIQDANQFCANCGVKFEISDIKQGTKVGGGIGLAIALTVLFSCAFCGLFTSVFTTTKETSTTKIMPSETPTLSPTQTPTFADLQTQTNILLNFNPEEHTDAQLEEYDKVMNALKAVPSASQDFKTAQKLHKQLLEKYSTILAEKLLLGAKPSEVDLKMTFNDYLRDRLNDYASSEYVAFSPAKKEYVKKEPFWTSVLRLRAKNAFGAYILRDVKFYIRQNKAVLVDGLN